MAANSHQLQFPVVNAVDQYQSGLDMAVPETESVVVLFISVATRAGCMHSALLPKTPSLSLDGVTFEDGGSGNQPHTSGSSGGKVAGLLDNLTFVIDTILMKRWLIPIYLPIGFGIVSGTRY